MENGLRLAEATGANSDIIQLFALFHDACRINEGRDACHAVRGAMLASDSWNVLYKSSPQEHDLLIRACALHTNGLMADDDITVQTCWDADRLDLSRVGISPNPQRLCTAAAKHPDILKWANERGASEVVPEMVEREWGIDLGNNLNRARRILRIDWSQSLVPNMPPAKTSQILVGTLLPENTV